MSSSSGAAKRVGFLELFFDLVFVFAITQLVGMLADDHSAAGWGRAALMLWLVWWAWSQYTWAGNAIDLEARAVRLVVLAVTGATLVAAVAIPTAFESGGWWFAVPYVAVRLTGLALYWFGLRNEPVHQAALRSYVPVAVLSPLLVLAGAGVSSSARVGLWVAAMVVDVASVLAAGRGEFRVDPGHFAERHGLIVIIALGESVVVIGSVAASIGLDRAEALLLATSFAVVAGLWWCYFDWVQETAEHHLAAEADHQRRGHLARDLYTFGHLPIVAGTVVFALAAKSALGHPEDPLEDYAVIALAIGPVLYLAGFVFGTLRTVGRVPVSRVMGMVAVGAWTALVGPRASSVVAMAGVAAVVVAVGLVESLQGRSVGSSHHEPTGGGVS
jgi:low temperature requirement protein LtrA